MARDYDDLDFLEELEKDAGVLGLPGVAALSRRAMLKRISATIGPHAEQALRGSPIEMRAVHKMLRNIPKGGTTGTADLSQVAPGFHQYILKGKKLEGEMLNRLVSPDKRSALVRPATPDSIHGILGQQMKRNPLATLIAGGGLGLAAKRLYEGKGKDSDRDRSGSRAIVLS